MLCLEPADHQLVKELLNKAVEEATATTAGLTEEDTASLRKLCEDVSEGLQKISSATTGPSMTRTVVSGVIDAEVLALHQQVQEAAVKVSALRTSVPQLMSRALCQQLEIMRPPAPPPTLEGVCQPSVTPGTADASDMELENMRGLLAAAMDKMPGLRARLEQAEQRLGRVVHVVEGDQARPSPRTVEKLLRGQPLEVSCGEQLKSGCH